MWGVGDLHIVISIFCVALGAELDESVTAWRGEGDVELGMFGGGDEGEANANRI